MKKPSLVLASLLSALATAGATPAGIDGLRLWLDASDNSTITLSGANVMQWADKSGFGNHAVQTDVNRQPVVGAGAIAGQNSIRLDAVGIGNFTSNPTDDGMAINPGGGFTLNRNYTAYLVDQYWGTNAQGRTLSGNVNNWLLGHWNGLESHFTGDFIGPNIGAGINNPLFSEAIGTGASNYLNRDFRSRAYVNNLHNNPGALSLGEDALNGFNEASQSDIGEVIAFNRALTDTERWQVQDYLRTKYNQPFATSHAHATRSTVFTGGDAGEGLDFQGNFVAAVNVGGPGGFNIGNAAFTSDTGVTAENHIPNWMATDFGGATPTANDSNLRTVMNSIRWSSPNAVGIEDVTVEIPGLTPGKTYKVQMLFAENGVNSSRHHAVELEGKTIHNDYSEGAFRGVDNPNGLGNALIHEFVAQDTTLNFRLHSAGLAHGDLNQLLNGFTLEDRGVTGVSTTGTFTSAAQLDFAGNFNYAVTMGGGGGQVVGSATFTSEFVTGVQVGAENVISNTWTPGANFGPTSDDANLSGAMSSIRWNETNGIQDGLSLDLDVVMGDTYKLQLLFMEGCCDRGFDVAFEGVRTLDNFNPNAMGANIANNRGAVITHEFTAGDGVFNVMLDGFATPFPDKNPILNAFTLERLIPEPGTAGLTLFAGALLLRRRRPAGN